ncbi:ABC transporter permease [Peptostreptococcaceae bacterium OttesenSCG-928-C18]|nr:ABC transporter permease [Peptostreptococcaceae bacterium OttesenSCG-928-C18]
MFNCALFKQSIKKNVKLWIILTSVICFFDCMVAFLAKVNPDFNLPGSPSGFDLITVYAGAFYGMMGLLLFLIYIIATGNKLVVSEVDKGEMSYTLNTPVSRRDVIFTKAIFYILSITAMVLALSIVGTVANAVLSLGKLDYGIFWIINFVMFCFLFAISGISFLASCWFNKSGSALIIGAGLPIAFFLFNTIASFGSELKFFKYITLNTLFDPVGIIAGNSFMVEALVLFEIGIVLYAIGFVKFLKKDLSL